MPPLVKTESNGSCFVEALLLHTMEINPKTHSVSRDTIQEICNTVQGIHPAMSKFLNGAEQQAVADYLDLSYAIIDIQRKCAALFVANRRLYSECRYAVLVQSKTRSHVDVLKPQSASKCELLLWLVLQTFLNEFHIELPELPTCSVTTVDLTL